MITKITKREKRKKAFLSNKSRELMKEDCQNGSPLFVIGAKMSTIQLYKMYTISRWRCIDISQQLFYTKNKDKFVPGKCEKDVGADGSEADKV